MAKESATHQGPSLRLATRVRIPRGSWIAGGA